MWIYVYVFWVLVAWGVYRLIRAARHGGTGARIALLASAALLPLTAMAVVLDPADLRHFEMWCLGSGCDPSPADARGLYLGLLWPLGQLLIVLLWAIGRAVLQSWSRFQHRDREDRVDGGCESQISPP